MAVGVVMLIVLISFVASCLGGKAKKDEGEDVDEHQYNSSKRVGKADWLFKFLFDRIMDQPV